MFPFYLIKIRFTAVKFFQSRLRILDFVHGTFEKKSGKKINCGIGKKINWWPENVDVTLPDSVFSKKVRFQKILPINVLEIFVGKNIRGNKKLEQRVSIKVIIEFKISYFNKSILKSPRRKSLLDDSFCNFSNKGEINSLVKWLIGSEGCLYMQPTITSVGSEQIISIKGDLIFPRSSILRSFLSW